MSTPSISQQPDIALLICTRNNPDKLQHTLDEIARHLVGSPAQHAINLILIDQTNIPASLRIPAHLNIRHIRTPDQKGISKARNLAIRSTNAAVLAWTDDDCIVTAAYFERLMAVAREAGRARQMKLAGVFGRTDPYIPTRPTPEHHCPSTFSRADAGPVTGVKAHWKYVGVGNNMIIFRHVFEALGGFREWMGEGAVGGSGEDAEFMIRCLAAGYHFAYDDDMLIYHNKWLDVDARRAIYRRYNCASAIVYRFYALHGAAGAQNVLTTVHQSSIYSLKHNLKTLKRSPQRWRTILPTILMESYLLLKGWVVAYFFTYVARQGIRANPQAIAPQDT